MNLDDLVSLYLKAKTPSASDAQAALAKSDAPITFNAAKDSQAASAQRAAAAAPVFNAAKDSQQANVDNHLSAVTTDATIPKGFDKSLASAGASMLSQSQKKDQPPPIQQSMVDVGSPTLQNPYAVSSKSLKTKSAASMQSLMARGSQPNANPIDANGVTEASIQELTKQLAAAKKRLAALQHRKGATKK